MNDQIFEFSSHSANHKQWSNIDWVAGISYKTNIMARMKINSVMRHVFIFMTVSPNFLKRKYLEEWTAIFCFQNKFVHTEPGK